MQINLKRLKMHWKIINTDNTLQLRKLPERIDKKQFYENVRAPNMKQ